MVTIVLFERFVLTKRPSGSHQRAYFRGQIKSTTGLRTQDDPRLGAVGTVANLESDLNGISAEDFEVRVLLLPTYLVCGRRRSCGFECDQAGPKERVTCDRVSAPNGEVGDASTLLVSQHVHRIDFRRAACRQEASNERDGNQ